MTKIQARSLRPASSPQKKTAIKKKNKIDESRKTKSATKKTAQQPQRVEKKLTQAIHLIKGHSATTYIDESIIKQITNDANSIKALAKLLNTNQPVARSKKSN